MKERGILFSAPMVRAMLDGSKTQTRRAVKRQPGPRVVPYNTSTGGWNWVLPETGHGTGDPFPCPYGQPGDRLRVKEAAWMWCERRPNGKTKTGRDKWLYVPMREAPVHYAADHPAKPAIRVVSPDTGNQWGWRLKIGRFLPAWAVRSHLEVTAVRVERLQDITEADCWAEGIEAVDGMFDDRLFDIAKRIGRSWEDAAPTYAALWESINGAGSWDANPWVWAVSFKRVTP